MIKKLFFLLTVLLLGQKLQAQFALERTYDHSLTTTRIHATEYKYYLMDVTKSECRIYHLDHTLWKTIPISLPSGYFLNDVKFVTQNLFNSDSDVELWYSAYNWVTVGIDGYYRYISRVITEKGVTLATIENGAYAYIIPAGENLYKMTVYSYDNSFWPGSVKTSVFSLPGTATAAFHAVSRLDDPYPNPAGTYINLPLSDIHQSGTLEIYSMSGQLITEIALTGQPLVQLHTSGW